MRGLGAVGVGVWFFIVFSMVWVGKRDWEMVKSELLSGVFFRWPLQKGADFGIID